MRAEPIGPAGPSAAAHRAGVHDSRHCAPLLQGALAGEDVKGAGCCVHGGEAVDLGVLLGAVVAKHEPAGAGGRRAAAAGTSGGAAPWRAQPAGLYPPWRPSAQAGRLRRVAVSGGLARRCKRLPGRAWYLVPSRQTTVQAAHSLDIELHQPAGKAWGVRGSVLDAAGGHQGRRRGRPALPAHSVAGPIPRPSLLQTQSPASSARILPRVGAAGASHASAGSRFSAPVGCWRGCRGRGVHRPPAGCPKGR